MTANHNDPKILYTINGVKAYHIVRGKEECLTVAGPQTLSLLMVPTASPFADLPGSNVQEDDFYLHLHLPPELDLPLPATTQIYHQPPTSYLIPRWDLGPESGAFTRIEFPSPGSRKGLQEDVDTFETILAQCTAFLERAPPPKSDVKSPVKEKDALSTSPSYKSKRSETLPAYNPSEYGPGQAYAKGSHSSEATGRIVLIDEEDGSVIGELSDGYHVEDSKIKHGSKDPVEISLPTNGGQSISVMPSGPEYVERDIHPAYNNSTLVGGAKKASRLIVTTSDLITRTLQNQADSYTKRTERTSQPVTFDASTHNHIRRINQISAKAASMSAITVGHISKVAQNLGANFSRKKDGASRGYDANGNINEAYKPGLLNKSLMAFNTVVDGIDHATRTFITGTSSSVTTVVDHRWGSEAGQISREMGTGFKNVALVYIDVTGVSRKAILKSVAKGMVVGNVSNGGGKVVVGDGDGGTVVMPGSEKPKSPSPVEGKGKKADRLA
ncbi:hypothetical protein TD95_001130 [Thielaviopsis punctulata]|uniref:Senescence domain-containing protein n=1 Tax=Thielaviopsis punctulata TaxID=72032 RepID=A0A0F4Z9A2_9PEZI|nr:hypothetical protein TD95_001130 [Thielaviopsis punctulata]